MAFTIILFILGLIGFALGIAYLIGKIVFVALYGEQIRQLIINMPEYKLTWFAIVGLEKPIKPWQLVRVTFFVIRLMGVVFTKHTTVINEEFKNKLPKKVFIFLRCLSWISILGVLLIVIPGLILLLTQPS